MRLEVQQGQASWINRAFYFLYFDASTSQAFLTVDTCLSQVGHFLEIISYWGAHLSNANQAVQSPHSNQRTHSQPGARYSRARDSRYAQSPKPIQTHQP